jgi:hypothetical protein
MLLLLLLLLVLYKSRLHPNNMDCVDLQFCLGLAIQGLCGQ